MKSTPAVLLSGIAALALSGCASIINGSRQDLSITSRPANADVKISKAKGGETVFQGITPCTARLNRGNGPFSSGSYLLQISAPGYATKTIPIQSRLSGWYFGNLFFGGLVGLLIVDPLTGGMWALPQEEVGVGLEPIGKARSTSTTTSSMRVVSLDQVPLHLRGKMKPLAALSH